MTNIIRRLLAPAALLLAALPAAAQPPRSDLLREAQQLREISTQKAEADLRNTLRSIKGMKAGDALALLRKHLAEVEPMPGLDSDRKARIVAELKRQIHFVEQDARSRGESLQPTAPPPAVLKEGKENARKAELDAREAERLRINEAVTRINQLLGQRREQEAERQALELAREYPNNPAARVMSHNASLRVRIRDAQTLLKQQEASIAAALRDVSPKLPGEDVEFDKKLWKQVAKSKFRGNENPLTAKEKAILKALNSMVQPEFKNARFDDVIDQLQKAVGAPIIVDRKAMEDIGLSSESLVNLSLPREVSLRTVLRKVLLDQGLGYVIRDEMIHVTTLTKTREMMTTRPYYIGDLTTPNALTTPPWLAGQQEEAVVRMIIDSIKRSVDPMSWEGEGGRATIHYDPVTRALIIRQSAEVHMMLRGVVPD